MCHTQMLWEVFAHRIAVAMSWGTLLVPTLLFRSTRPRSFSSGNLSRAALTLLTYLHILDGIGIARGDVTMQGNIHHV